MKRSENCTLHPNTKLVFGVGTFYFGSLDWCEHINISCYSWWGGTSAYGMWAADSFIYYARWAWISSWTSCPVIFVGRETNTYQLLGKGSFFWKRADTQQMQSPPVQQQENIKPSSRTQGTLSFWSSIFWKESLFFLTVSSI